jgi:hypothetical protein
MLVIRIILGSLNMSLLISVCYKDWLAHRALCYKPEGLGFQTLYPQKWALTSPTSGGRSVDVVR